MQKASSTILLLLLPALAACATPSRSELAAQESEMHQMSSAHAVHLPKGVDPCVGVTLRLSDPAAPGEIVKARDDMAHRLMASDAENALASAGVATCKDIYLDAVAHGQTAPEPMMLSMSYGIDPAGKVCAVVERTRNDPVDPNAVGVIEESANCLKDALFRAQFPVGLVKDRERIVLTYHLTADPVERSSSEGPGSPGGQQLGAKKETPAQNEKPPASPSADK
jgi:hypothetical protein